MCGRYSSLILPSGFPLSGIVDNIIVAVLVYYRTYSRSRSRGTVPFALFGRLSPLSLLHLFGFFGADRSICMLVLPLNRGQSDFNDTHYAFLPFHHIDNVGTQSCGLLHPRHLQTRRPNTFLGRRNAIFQSHLSGNAPTLVSEYHTGCTACHDLSHHFLLS